MATNSKGDNVTKSVSMDRAFSERVESHMESIRAKNFSEYVRDLIEDDFRQNEIQPRVYGRHPRTVYPAIRSQHSLVEDRPRAVRKAGRGEGT